jgi:tetratricopeptide (TPR) repeat protein
LSAILIVAAVLAFGLAALAWHARWSARAIVAAAGLAALLTLAAFLVRPDSGPATVAVPDAMLTSSAMAFNSPGMPTMPSTSGAAGALPELADRLAARLVNSPDDPQGWSLLAATYRQLGREQEAATAEKRAIEAGADPAALVMAHQPGIGPAGAAQSAVGRYVATGQRLKIQRRFQEAELEFRKAVEADPRDADSWADVADCAAAAAGNDLSAGRDAIARALQINPRHRKALWLKASLELQEGRYASASETWRTLSALVAAGSPDARVIDANIAEANALAAKSAG